MKTLQKILCSLGFLAIPLFADVTYASGQLDVGNAWIRLPPPGTLALAGYATLKNTGDASVMVLAVESSRFRMTSIHQTIVENGVARMRDLQRLKIDPNVTVELTPGGKHLMLMQPRTEVVAGDKIEVAFLLTDGTRVPVIFEVRAAEIESHR